MYVSRVPTVVSLRQLEEDSPKKLGGNAPVSDCAHKELLKISFAFKKEVHCTRVRSFGELRDLEDWEKSPSKYPSNVSSSDDESTGAALSQLSSDSEGNRSALDLALLGLWEMCGEDGLFRYDVTACKTKPIPGVYGFIAQLNEGRATKKRPTEFRVDQVIQPFNEEKFNFLKAYMKEVLFQFDAEAVGETVIDESGVTGKSPNLVLINVSPIEYGHVLLVPKIKDKLQQLVCEETTLLALQFAAAADNPYFRVGYNSLGAYATINHLHFQAYYLMAPYPVERAPTCPIPGVNCRFPGVRVSQLAEYPVKGFVFEMTSTLEQMAKAVSYACIQMQKANIPHNFLISDCGARVFLWPQCYAEKQAQGLVPEEILATGVNPAVFEIAGHMILKVREDFEHMTQKKAWQMLAEVSLSEKRFNAVAKLCLE